VNYKKIRISYDEYGSMINELTEKLRGKIDIVYGVPRGGLSIAVHISHHLGIPLVTNLKTLKTVYYQKLLLVDDIVQTGKTFSNIINFLTDGDVDKQLMAPAESRTSFFWSNILTASLYNCPMPRKCVPGVPNISLADKQRHEWIVFPWERMEEEPNR